MNLDFSWLNGNWSYYGWGALHTLQLSVLGVLFGTFFGVLFALLRLSKLWVLKAFAATYIELIRGTPMLVQILIIYFGLTSFGINLPPFVAGVVALTINSAAYMAEVFRAGIQAIDKGQSEAARSLGMSSSMTMRLIVLPQAFRNMLPAIGNELIVIIKDSSLISVVGIAELMYQAQALQGMTFRPMEPLLVAGGIYFIMTFILSRLLAMLERRLDKR